MVLWLLVACVPHVASVPIPEAHTGRPAQSPCLPLPPIWVESTLVRCAPLADALRYVLVEHAEQVVLPEADTRIRITSCQTQLEERISLSAEKTAELGGQEVLDALLTGQATMDIEIWRFGLPLERLNVESVEIEQQEWISGGQYPWRAALTLQTEQVLVEHAETALLQPRRSLCISSREQARSLSSHHLTQVR